jgi:hypothetical protein
MATTAVLTNLGEAWIINSINQDAPAQMHHIGWGTGAGTAAKADVALFTASAEARSVATLTKPTADTWKATATIVSASQQVITNVGAWDVAVAGNLGIHISFTGVGLEISDSITFEITLEST